MKTSQQITYVSTGVTKEDGIIIKYQLQDLQEKFIYRLLNTPPFILHDDEYTWLRQIISDEEYTNDDRTRLNELRIEYKNQ